MLQLFDWHVTTLWVKCLAMGQPTSQLSLPSLRDRWMNSNPCNYVDYSDGDHIYSRPGLCMAVIGQRLWVHFYPTAYTLFARSLCDVQRRCSCRLWHYMSVMLLPFLQVCCFNNFLTQFCHFCCSVCFCLLDWSDGSRPFTGFICSSVLMFHFFLFLLFLHAADLTFGQLLGERKNSVWLIAAKYVSP